MSVSASVPRSGTSASRVWLRALEKTAPISRNPERILATVIEEIASRRGDAPALLCDRESLSYRELAGRVSQYAQWALDQNLRKGEVVGLLMTSRPEYFALWLGITAVGGVVALLNTHLSGEALAHCINVVHPKHLIVADEFSGVAAASLTSLPSRPEIWIHGADHQSFRRIDVFVHQLPFRSLTGAGLPRVTIDDLALHVYTSGTTGLPKAARITHGRILHWSNWFAGLLDVQPDDRMYDSLPMYHSVGGVLAPAATLVGGGSVVVRESFSAGEFWNDIVRWDCTMLQYIGEFCRYVLQAPPGRRDRDHRVRVACGNGLAPDVWQAFQDRFGIRQILEFYASTEGGLSLFNVEGEPGSMGRVPPYLAHRFAPALVEFDPETAMPQRNAEGFCVACAPNEPGEALARVLADPSQAGSRFEGYTDASASDGKLLRDVFQRGDVWVRTGDLMRRDSRGFYYYVDRVGDTFRWKGENVATTEVAEAISRFPGVQHAVVYGVKVGKAEGRIGMAALSLGVKPHLADLRRHVMASLPSYARPAFLRFCDNFEVTGTFKYSKSELVRQGYDPRLIADAVYFDNPETQALQRVDQALYDRIQTGQIRL
ncbi:MAG: long-chain-acyl-CoA synthetase [Acidobacteriaceae bacterium]